MVSQAELIYKSYYSLVHGIISIFLEMVWVPLKDLHVLTVRNHEKYLIISYFLNKNIHLIVFFVES